MSDANQPDFQDIMRAIMQSIVNAQNSGVIYRPPQLISMNDDEFLDVIDKIDELGNNFFHFACQKVPKERMELTINKLERVASREKIREILTTLSHSNHNMLQLAAKHNECPEVNQTLWNFIRKYFNSSELLDMLKHDDRNGNNVLHLSVLYNKQEVVEVILNEIKSVYDACKDKEFFDFLKTINNDNENVLHLAMKSNDEITLSFLWNELKSYQQFQELFHQTVSKEERSKLFVFHYASLSGSIEFHMKLWNLLLNTFPKHEELVNLLLQRNEHGDNFFHYIIIYNNPEIIKYTFEKIKDVFSDVHYKEILRTKGQMDRNILQFATIKSKDINTYKFLWKMFKDSFKTNILEKLNLFTRPSRIENSETFTKFLMQLDTQKLNVFHSAICFTTEEIFVFMLKELENVTTREEIRTILGASSQLDKNILQLAAVQNMSLTVHQQLWKVIHKYFNRSEIIEMIKNSDETGYNLLNSAVQQNTKEVVELIWNEIAGIFRNAELTEYLRHVTKDNLTIMFILINTNDEKKLKFLWTKIKAQFMSSSNLVEPKSQINCHAMFKDLLIQKNIEANASFLHVVAEFKDIKFYKTLWDLLLNTFDNRDELKEFIMHKSNTRQRFLHRVVFNGDSDIITFLFSKLKAVFGHEQFKEILKSKAGDNNMNLIQYALIGSTDIEIHRFLWTLTNEYLGSSEMLEFVESTDKDGHNLFGIAVLSPNNNIAEFAWNQIKLVYSKFGNVGLKELLIKTNVDREIMLYGIVRENNATKFKYFWLEYEKHLTNQEFKEFLVQKNLTNHQSLLHLAGHCNVMEFHEIMWQFLLKTFTNREELKDFILDSTKNGNNLFSILLLYNQADIIEFNLKKIMKNFTRIQQKQILTTKVEKDKTLLHCAGVYSNKLKVHQILWQAIRDCCESDEEMLQIIKQTQHLDSNILQIAVLYTTEEIFRFIIEELEKIASREEIRNILGNIGSLGSNLLQIASTSRNECFKYHAFLWKTIRKYFDSSEIAVMVKSDNEMGHNLILIAVEHSSKDVVKQYWNEIKNVLDKDLVEYVKHVDKNEKNIIHYLVEKQDAEMLNYLWKEIEGYSENKNSDLLQKLIIQRAEDSNKNILSYAALSKEVKFHKILWDLLLKSISSPDELNDLITQKTNDGMNFIQHLIAYNKIEVIELNLRKIKHVLSDVHFKEILTSSESKYNNGLLQIASNALDDVNDYQKFWKLIHQYSDSATILEMLKHINYKKENLLLLDFKFNPNENIKLTWNEIKLIASENKNFGIIEYLSAVNDDELNVLHMLIARKYPDELKYFWSEFERYFKSQKGFREFISQTIPETSQTILHRAVHSKTLDFQETFWNLLLKSYDNQEELMKFLMHRDINGNTFLLYAVNENTSDIISYILNKLKDKLSSKLFAELINAKGGFKRNIIQRAAIGSDDIKMFQILLQNVQKCCKSNEEFLKIFSDKDEKGSNLVHITASTSCNEIFVFTMQCLEKIANRDEIRKLMSSKGLNKTNLLQVATIANASIDSHQSLWKVIKKYFNSSEIFEMINYKGDDFECHTWFLALLSPKLTEDIRRLIWNEIQQVFDMFGDNCAEKMLEYLMQTNTDEETIIYYLIRQNHDDKLEFYWNTCEQYFKSHNSPNLFKDLIIQKTSSSSESILHAVAKTNDFDCHKTIWNLLLKTFENREEFKNFVLEKDESGDNFFPNLFIHSQPDVIEINFEKIKEALSNEQFEEIVKSKFKAGKNLLQVAVCTSKNDEVHQAIWQIIQGSCKSNEDFLEFLESTDDDHSNVFYDAAAFSSNESYFEFAIEELTKITTRNKIRQIFTTLGPENRNLLQISSLCKKYEIYQSLWKINFQYFDSMETLNMISHTDEHGLSLLYYVAKSGMENIIELTLAKVKPILEPSNNVEVSNNILKLWQECESILTKCELDSDNWKLLKSNWTELVINVKAHDSKEIHIKISNQVVTLDQNPLKFLLQDYNILHRMLYCNEIEVQTSSWKIVFDSFQNKNELKDLMLLKDVNGNNFVHSLVLNGNTDLINLIFLLMEENFSTSQFHEILRSKGQYEGNLLYIAALYSKEIKVHQVLWKIFRQTFKTELLEILIESDRTEDNVLNTALRFGTKEIVDFIFNQLEEFASFEEIETILKTTGRIKRNLLQVVAEECLVPEIHMILWQQFRKYFNSQEIIEFINQCDEDGDRLIHNVVGWNTKEIIDLTWEHIKTFITSKDDQIEYLKTTGCEGQNLKQRVADNEDYEVNAEVQAWVNQVLNEYGIEINSE